MAKLGFVIDDDCLYLTTENYTTLPDLQIQFHIEKAKEFKFDLNDAVMASDACFPFPDCVEIAHNEGIRSVIQPGGSIKDQASIDYCDAHQMGMVFTGIRHFKH